MFNWIRRKIANYRYKRELRAVKEWLISEGIIEAMSDEEFEKLCEEVGDVWPNVAPLTGITMAEASERLVEAIRLINENILTTK